MRPPFFIKNPCLRYGIPESFSDSEFLDYRTVAIDILLDQVIKKIPSLTHEENQSSLGVVILSVVLQVLRKVLNPERIKGYLTLG